MSQYVEIKIYIMVIYYGIFDMATLEIYFVDVERLWIVPLRCFKKN